MELLLHLLEDALEDTLYLVPFLLVTYVLLELLEHKAGTRSEEIIQKAGAAGPAIGALLGAVPQCGFSAAGSALYANRAITLGTLFAIMLSTSDEMLPVFIAEQTNIALIAVILISKIIIGMIMGFAIDGILRLYTRRTTSNTTPPLTTTGKIFQLTSTGVCFSPPAHTHEHSRDESCENDTGFSSWKHIGISAIKRTLEVALIVYLISLALVAIMELIGEAAIASFLAQNPSIAIFGAALVGLIPNCGASVVIAELYLEGMLQTGAMMAGLLVSAGVSLLVLFGENHHLKQNILILLGLYITGVVWGLLFDAVGIVF